MGFCILFIFKLIASAFLCSDSRVRANNDTVPCNLTSLVVTETWQSSVYVRSQVERLFFALNAIHGFGNPTDVGYVSGFMNGQCIQTTLESGPWYQLQLDTNHYITSVVLTSSAICSWCSEQLSLWNISVEIGSVAVNYTLSDAFWETSWQTRKQTCLIHAEAVADDATITLNCSEPIYGNFVRITKLANDSILSMCDVLVLGVTDTCAPVTSIVATSSSFVSAIVPSTPMAASLFSTAAPSSSSVPSEMLILSTPIPTLILPTTSLDSFPTTSLDSLPTASTESIPTASSEILPTASSKTLKSSSYSFTPSLDITPTYSAGISSSVDPLSITSISSSIIPTSAMSISSISSSLIPITPTPIWCPCHCESSQIIEDLTSNNKTNEEVAEEVEQMLQEQTVDAKTTTVSQRQHVSAGDKRTSSKAIGTIGVLFFVGTFAVIFLSDLPHFIDISKHLVKQLNAFRKRKLRLGSGNSRVGPISPTMGVSAPTTVSS